MRQILIEIEFAMETEVDIFKTLNCRKAQYKTLSKNEKLLFFYF